MSEALRISIVIPTYNAAAHLAATIESVRAQTFAGWEFVLFDDGSSDTTVSLAEELARNDERIHVVRGGHYGVAGARNRGFQETSLGTEFVAFLDHDDVWEPTALEFLPPSIKARLLDWLTRIYTVSRRTVVEQRHGTTHSA
jgi:glycosyltransferase involved in cell wall biosynthesis